MTNEEAISEGEELVSVLARSNVWSILLLKRRIEAIRHLISQVRKVERVRNGLQALRMWSRERCYAGDDSVGIMWGDIYAEAQADARGKIESLLAILSSLDTETEVKP